MSARVNIEALSLSRRAAVAVLVLLALSAARAELAPLGSIEWRPPDASGARTLVLRLPAATRAEVRVTPSGLEVWLPGTATGTEAVPGVELRQEDAGTRLRIPGEGLLVGGLTIDGPTLAVLVKEPLRGRAGAAYRIGVGDVVSVVVYKNQDLSGDVTVAPDGTIQIPLVGAITAQGATDAELADRIREVLSGFLVEPQVTVTVRSYASQYVYVTGAVPRATRVALRPEMTIEDILSEAGVALTAGQEIELTRTKGEAETHRWSGSELEQARGIALRDGDVLTVQEPKFVYTNGEIRRPNRFVLTPGLTLLQVLSLSEGLTEWASRKDVRILRGPDASRQEIRINLNDIEERRVPDPLLMPGDMVLVRRRIL